jgi:CRISPR/Cas system-associated exonuclease Cas4 (RecB family)
LPRTSSGDPQPTIRASEIGEYSYCSRAWWYRHVIKIAPPAPGTGERLNMGIQAHRQHGRQVARASLLATVGLALALLGALALVLAFVLR